MRVADWRVIHTLKHQTVTVIAGTSSVYISRIECGERRAGRKLRAKLGRTLDVEPGLLEGDDDPRRANSGVRGLGR